MTFANLSPLESDFAEEIPQDLETLKRELRKARELIRIAPAFFGFLSLEGKVLDVNDLALDAIGSARGDVIGKIFWDLPWWKPIPDSAWEVHEAVLKVISEKRATRLELRYWAHGGDTRWVTLEISPILDASGELTKLSATGIDVTERKAVGQSETRSREELESIFQQSPVPTVILSGPDFRFVLANPPYQTLIGRDVLGKTVAEAFTQGEVDQFLPLLDSVYTTGVPYLGKEAYLALPGQNGELQERWVNFGYYPFRNSLGETQGILAIIQDVTELVTNRRIAEENARTLKCLFEAMPQMSFVADRNGNILSYNQRWYDYINGMKGSEGWGWKELPIHHPDDRERVVKRWQESVSTGKPYEIEYQLRRYDGEYRWHLGRAVPLRDEHGEITGWIGTNTDIHDQKQAVHDLVEERELKERFISALSHDLRNPLIGAKLSAQLIPRKIHDTSAILKFTTRIVHHLDRSERMIRDLLDVSKMRAGSRPELVFELCDLVEIAQETIEELTSVYGDRFNLQLSGEIVAMWSRDSIQRILENLCGNAIKYGASDGRVTIAVSKADQSVRLEVHNVGNPIPISEQEQIFSYFQRAESAKKSHQKGWGIGLALVKGLALSHGASVGVESSSTKGTTFFVDFPI